MIPYGNKIVSSIIQMLHEMCDVLRKILEIPAAVCHVYSIGERKSQ